MLCIFYTKIYKKRKIHTKRKVQSFSRKDEDNITPTCKKDRTQNIWKAEKIQLWFIISHRNCFYASLLVQK